MADQKLETMTGRIYRVLPAGSHPLAPKLDLSSASGCVAALQSPNLSTRYLAWTKLQAKAGAAETELVKVWISDDPRMRARALQLLARIPGRDQPYLQQAVKDPNPDLRITGLRITRALNVDVIPSLKLLAHDPSAAVRRECALALRHNHSPDAPRLWAQLAEQHDGQDRWYLEALGIGADHQWDAYLDAWLTAVGDRWDTPAGRDIIWRSRAKKTPGLLVKIISDKGLTADQRDHYFRSLDFINGPEKETALLELLTAK